ncbi:MAG: response regulator [Bacteroidota bacterium]
MFNKVLIAEDHGITGSGLKSSLADLAIAEIEISHYCDDALLKIKAAQQKKRPFEILITDLSFKEDFKRQSLQSGEALITEAKKAQPYLKVLVYSIEHRIGVIKRLFEVHGIHGFVEKKRKDFKEIEEAMGAIFRGDTYTSPELQQALRSSVNISELDDYDTLLLRLLSKGFKQEEISKYFQRKNYPASSLRSIQDRLGKLKIIFAAKTPTHLVAKAMEKGFI